MAGRYFSFQTYDKRHSRNLTARAKRVRKLYDDLAKAVSQVAPRTGFNDPEGTFLLNRYPRISKIITGLIDDTLSGVQTNAEEAVSDAIDLSATKNDALVSFLATQHHFSEELTTAIKKRNEEAQNSIKKRITEGMNLSENVWNLKGQLKQEIELALEVSLADMKINQEAIEAIMPEGIVRGRSAQALSRDVRNYLKYPDKLFRRVREKKTGQLRLSKAAAAFHPGQGVYRSSYKNALRMTGTETNIAYRSADCERWEASPQIVGIEVLLSYNHPVEDMCDELEGVYPKSFKFTGWHPQCRCTCMPKLVDDKEFKHMAQMSPDEYFKYRSPNSTLNVPEGFRKWIDKNRERAKGWKSEPYFIRDNKQWVDDFRVNVYSDVEKVFTRHGRTKEAMRVALEENLKKQYPELENTEIAAIYHYTQKYGSSFRHMNTSLRKGRPLDDFEVAFSELLSSGLRKLPAYEGESFRSIVLNKANAVELLSNAVNKEIVTFKGYTSSTLKKDIAEGFNEGKKGYKITFHIYGKTGRSLDNLSMFNGARGEENQFEVLFDKGSRFKFTKLSGENKQFVITAVEV